MKRSDKHTNLTLKRVFFTGILVTVPTSLTLFLFFWLATKIDNLGAWIVESFMPQVELYRGLGLIGTLGIIFGVGLITSNFFGKKIYEIYEGLFVKIPLINRVFSLLKKVLEMVLDADRNVFRHAVLVEFPRKELWIIGFLSAPAASEFNEKTGRELVSVFIPTTPNPTSGVLMLVPAEDIKILDMSIEDVSRVIISGGILTPEVIEEVQAGDSSSPVKRQVGA